ncbi:MAG: DegT/DnrJ/EryC1/StrS family aminotransferase [Planctomycetaceae bacterium]
MIPFPQSRPRQPIWKEVCDRVGAAIALVIVSPVFLLAAVIIKLNSRGPVFFSQQRVGLNEQPFTVYKFRTMHLNAAATHTGSTTITGDPRIFPGAQFLRTFKIDELPQLWNVLNGTMSIVGPRPTVEEDYLRMTKSQRRRAGVKPGLTGMAQIHGGAAIAWPVRIEHDLWYIEHFDWKLDLWIAWKTVWLVLLGRADQVPSHGDEWGLMQPATVPFSMAVSYNPAASVSAAQITPMLATVNPTTAASTAQSNPPPALAPWPNFEEDEIQAVVKVLRSGKVNYWTGHETRLFENEFAKRVGCTHAVALANGTVALELALKALGVGPGDDVVVPCRSFMASASSIVQCGANPVFADVDAQSQNITAETIRQVLTPNTRAVIVVHLAGWPCEMDAIMSLAHEHKFKVIEDCAQAHGSTHRGRPIGSLGHAAAFSFCQDKIMTTGGEGGMLTTNDEDVWKFAWSFKDHGKDWDAVHQPSDAIFKWVHHRFGTNWRMTEMQAAIGRLQLQKLDDWVQSRRRNAAYLNERFSRNPVLRLTPPPVECGHSYYKFYAFLRPEYLHPEWSRDRIVKEIQQRGIPCGSGSCSEIYREQAFEGTIFRPSHPLRVAQMLGNTSLMFLVHPTLTPQQMEHTADVVENVLTEATRSSERRENIAA